DHVVDPAAHPHVAAGVLGGQIAGQIPAIADRAGVGVRVVLVSSSPSGSRWASSSNLASVTGAWARFAAVLSSASTSAGSASWTQYASSAGPNLIDSGTAAAPSFWTARCRLAIGSPPPRREPTQARQRPGQLVGPGVPLPVGQRPRTADRSPAGIPVRGPGQHAGHVHDDPEPTHGPSLNHRAASA